MVSCEWGVGNASRSVQLTTHHQPLTTFHSQLTVPSRPILHQRQLDHRIVVVHRSLHR